MLKTDHSHLEHSQNQYAENVKQEVVFILDANRGKRGYFCLGCKREVIAKKGKINIPHFAHDPKDVTRKNKCTYSDETYRHWLAKQLLVRDKEVTVPALYKYPVDDNEGRAMLISPKRVIKASTALQEVVFYEDDNGKVCWGKEEHNSGRNNLIRVDVAFFDEKGLPILLIELVATHGITLEKKLIFHRLCIDTISN